MKNLFVCWSLLISLALPALSETPTVDREEYRLGLPVASTLAVIPTAANSPGPHGAYFKTRVVIHNLSNRSYDIQVALCTGSGLAKNATLSMRSNQYQWWDNFLETVFSYRGAGALILASDLEGDLETSPYKFSVTAEVYADSSGGGRYSTPVVSGIVPLVDLGTEAFSSGISVNDRQRVNIGIFNAAPDDVSAKVYDSSGNLAETVRFQANKFTWQQKPITRSVTNGYIEWSVSGGLPFLWAVTVNNQTNDGMITRSLEMGRRGTSVVVYALRSQRIRTEAST